MPKVTIGLPVYNGARSLARVIECLTSQTLSDIRIIVSDNGSTDGTADICRKSATADERISYYRQPEHLSLADNFNFVLQQADDEFFMWAAADDGWEPEYVERLLQAIERDEEAAVSFSNVLVIDRQGTPVCELSLDWLNRPTSSARVRAYVATDPIMGACNIMYGLFRREVLLRGTRQFFWSEAGHFGADFSFLLFVLLEGSVAYVPKTLFRKSAGGTSWHIRANMSAWEKFGHVKSMYLDAWRVLVEHDDLGAGQRIVSEIFLIYGFMKVLVARLLPANRFNRVRLLSNQLARGGEPQDR